RQPAVLGGGGDPGGERNGQCRHGGQSAERMFAKDGHGHTSRWEGEPARTVYGPAGGQGAGAGGGGGRGGAGWEGGGRGRGGARGSHESVAVRGRFGFALQST